MKKISFILLALLCWSSMVSAQENNNRLRKKYRNLSFVKQEFEPASYFGMDQTLKSNFGAAFTVGRTFYLHKKPIAGLIRFGLDATWFDLNYTNYKLEYRWEDNYDEEEEPETSNFHQAEIGMQVGPSVTVNPVGKLNVNAYFRFAPSFSALYDDDTLLGTGAGTRKIQIQRNACLPILQILILNQLNHEKDITIHSVVYCCMPDSLLYQCDYRL